MQVYRAASTASEQGSESKTTVKMFECINVLDPLVYALSYAYGNGMGSVLNHAEDLLLDSFQGGPIGSWVGGGGV